MATLGDFTLTLELPEHFHLLPEAVQMALVERIDWRKTSTIVVSVDSQSLVDVLQSDSYRQVRAN